MPLSLSLTHPYSLALRTSRAFVARAAGRNTLRRHRRAVRVGLAESRVGTGGGRSRHVHGCMRAVRGASQLAPERNVTAIRVRGTVVRLLFVTPVPLRFRSAASRRPARLPLPPLGGQALRTAALHAPSASTKSSPPRAGWRSRSWPTRWLRRCVQRLRTIEWSGPRA